MKPISTTLKIKPSWLKRILPLFTLVFAILVGYFLFKNISKINLQDIQMALRDVSWDAILGCLALTVVNYFVYACYDILSFNIMENASLRLRKIISSTLISFAFNLNLGALVGSIGFRYRIYSGWGIPHSKITLLTLLSVITSWSGYVLLLSDILLFKPELIHGWLPVSEITLRCCGGLGMLSVLVYLGLCFKRVTLNFHEHQFHFPPVNKALLQFLLSSMQWGIVAIIIYIFLLDLGAQVSFDSVLFSVLLSGIAGVLTHIPAGLGILETVFLQMHQDIPVPVVVAALLCYRFVYYLIPLTIAIPGYLYIEYYQKH